jgi:hypothetical protein
MTKDFTKTVRIRDVEKVAPDERGRNVWRGKVEPVELELVSTTSLEKILSSKGGKTRSEIRKLAAGKKEGVLARDTATGHFRILSEDDLRKALPAESPDRPKRDNEVASAPLGENAQRAAEELSLVNTQYLRKALKTDAEPESPKPRAGTRDKFGGYNPYGDD